MNRVCFRPKLEEFEPKIVPSGGPWHVLGGWLKFLAHNYRVDNGQSGSFEDPFCGGAPCVEDPAIVRAALNNLVDQWIYADGDLAGQVADAQANYQQLVDQGAPLGEQLNAKYYATYLNAREIQLYSDIQAVQVVTYSDDAHIVQAAQTQYTHMVSQSYNERASFDVTSKRDEARVRQLYQANPKDFNAIADAENIFAHDQGQFRQSVDDLGDYVSSVPS